MAPWLSLCHSWYVLGLPLPIITSIPALASFSVCSCSNSYSCCFIRGVCSFKKRFTAALIAGTDNGFSAISFWDLPFFFCAIGGKSGNRQVDFLLLASISSKATMLNAL